MKSKILSQLQNKVIYVALLILFLRLLEVSYVYVFPLLFIIYIVIKRAKQLLVYAGCISLLILISVIMISFKSTPSNTAIVKGDIKSDDITSFTATRYGKVYRIYTDEDVEIVSGDIITFTGEEQYLLDSTIPHTFNYKNYLLSKRINSTIFAEDIEVIGYRFSFDSIRSIIEKYIEKYAPQSSHYLKTFILADQSGFEDDIKENINILGVSHLFAVSGLHIGLLAVILDKGMKKFFPKTTPQKVIIPILLIYMIITSFSPSIIRATLLYVGLFINKKKNLEFSTLDILSFIFIGYLIVSPYAIYSLGFSLSFLVTYSILLGHYMLKEQSNAIQLVIISVLAILVALPITTTINHEVNLISIFVNVVLIYGMSFVILPMGYITFVLPFFDSLYYYLIVVYEKIITLFSSINIFRVKIVFINHLQVVMYYVLLFLLLGNVFTEKRKTYIFYMVIFLIVSMNIQTVNPIKSVSMIDVYGDSILIKDSFDRCNILVDTGVPDEYDSVVSYLKGRGIKRIDYFIITHEDSDHKGERDDIHASFDVGREINSLNIYEQTINCGSITISFFEFYDTYNNQNNQSIVFLMTFANKSYLFTGDMEQEKEQEFVELYDIDVDILKSGHHGSITSSTEEFLDTVNAEEVWISCYRKNTHNHPNDIVIERYEERNMEIYRTDLMGTIEEYYIFGKAYKKYHMPLELWYNVIEVKLWQNQSTYITDLTHSKSKVKSTI